MLFYIFSGGLKSKKVKTVTVAVQNRAGSLCELLAGAIGRLKSRSIVRLSNIIIMGFFLVISDAVKGGDRADVRDWFPR